MYLYLYTYIYGFCCQSFQLKEVPPASKKTQRNPGFKLDRRVNQKNWTIAKTAKTNQLQSAIFLKDRPSDPRSRGRWYHTAFLSAPDQMAKPIQGTVAINFYEIPMLWYLHRTCNISTSGLLWWCLGKTPKNAANRVFHLQNRTCWKKLTL